MDEQQLTILEQKLSKVYTFNNRFIALQAIQTSGMPIWFQGRQQNVANNKNLAILGDNLLDHHLCLEWMQTNTSREEYARRRSIIASNRNLDRVGRENGLDECVIRRSDAIQPVGFEVMATTVEAILGAVFLDANARLSGSGVAAVIKVASGLGLNFSE